MLAVFAPGLISPCPPTTPRRAQGQPWPPGSRAGGPAKRLPRRRLRDFSRWKTVEAEAQVRGHSRGVGWKSPFPVDVSPLSAGQRPLALSAGSWEQ
jgi:hypothetical protein